MPISFLASAAVAAAPPTATLNRRLLADVRAGLRCAPRLPTQYLYDARGSALFERITVLPEYYLTRTELTIFDAHVSAMAAVVGPDAWVIEPGSGSGVKTRKLLSALETPAGYTPIEISASALRASVRQLEGEFPALHVVPQRGDFTSDLALPAMPSRKRVCFFPGSTLGNFDEPAARRLLRRIAGWVAPGGGLLIGVDLVKSPDLLIPAYDDAEGVTAAFNLNLLRRINREADADFELDAWTHRAVWDAPHERMESYLVSDTAQRVTVAGEAFEFERGEAVWTEQSQKYTLDRLCSLAEGFTLRQHWTDDRSWFAVAYLEADAV